ncbi:MAG TPA: hypothetical protein VF610_02085 [Segetibacter sp.]
MKHTLILFLFLCFNLAGVENFAHASVHTATSHCIADPGNESTKQFEKVTNNNSVAPGNIGLTKEDVLFIATDDKDEDEDIIRKHVLSFKHLLVFSTAFFLNERYSRLANHFSFCKPFSYTSSCKYIVQRALRI